MGIWIEILCLIGTLKNTAVSIWIAASIVNSSVANKILS